MKKIAAFMALVLWAPAGLANECMERIDGLARPIFPQSYQQLLILQKEKICSVETAFSINVDGRAENIEYRVRREICKPFNVIAIRAIRSTTFSPGPHLNVCFLRLTFEIVDGQFMWWYD